MEDLATLIVLVLALPYVLGVPIAILWVALAYIVDKFTRYSIVPADIRFVLRGNRNSDQPSPCCVIPVGNHPWRRDLGGQRPTGR